MTDRVQGPIRQLMAGATEHAVGGYKVCIAHMAGGVRLMVFRGGLIYTHRYRSEREALDEMETGSWKHRQAREARRR